MPSVTFGLGSNLGDRLSHLRQTIDALQAQLGMLTLSRVYESQAHLLPGSPPEWNRPYLNMAAQGQTTLPPEKLLDLTQAIERQLGRDHAAPRWSPRPIDIDILYYGDVALQSERLTLPHPRIHERDFVLSPLNDLKPLATSHLPLITPLGHFT